MTQYVITKANEILRVIKHCVNTEFCSVTSCTPRGGSRGGQSGHATHVKNAQVINIQS